MGGVLAQLSPCMSKEEDKQDHEVCKIGIIGVSRKARVESFSLDDSASLLRNASRGTMRCLGEGVGQGT